MYESGWFFALGAVFGVIAYRAGIWNYNRKNSAAKDAWEKYVSVITGNMNGGEDL